MKFDIQTSPVLTDCYVVEVEFMQGDGDYYEKKATMVMNSIHAYQDLEKILIFFNKCMDTPSDDYSDIEGFQEYGDGFIPHDPHCGMPAEVQEINLFYYTDTGSKRRVKYYE